MIWCMPQEMDNLVYDLRAANIDKVPFVVPPRFRWQGWLAKQEEKRSHSATVHYRTPNFRHQFLSLLR